jgi:hypothetical protein
MCFSSSSCEMSVGSITCGSDLHLMSHHSNFAE